MKKKQLPIVEISQVLICGYSEKQILERLGVSQQQFRKRLVDTGITKLELILPQKLIPDADLDSPLQG